MNNEITSHDGKSDFVLPKMMDTVYIYVMQPLQTVAEDVFIWSVEKKCSVNPLLTAL